MWIICLLFVKSGFLVELGNLTHPEDCLAVNTIHMHLALNYNKLPDFRVVYPDLNRTLFHVLKLLFVLKIFVFIKFASERSSE